jgi:hypothetical protein
VIDQSTSHQHLLFRITMLSSPDRPLEGGVADQVTVDPEKVIEGYGLYAMETIHPGEMVCEYVGEICRSAVAEVREQRYLKQGIGSSYLFRIDSDLVCHLPGVDRLHRIQTIPLDRGSRESQGLLSHRQLVESKHIRLGRIGRRRLSGEGWKKVPVTAKAEYLPERNRAVVSSEKDANALTSGRTARVTGQLAMPPRRGKEGDHL